MFMRLKNQIAEGSVKQTIVSASSYHMYQAHSVQIANN